MTQIVWGYEASNAHSSNRVPIATDFLQVVNPHIAICGDSGTGKTHTIRHAISEVLRTAKRPVRIHIFDVHGDIKIDERVCSTVTFSASSPYGFNPLVVDPSPDFGGVHKCIQWFISTLKLSPTTSRALGPKQQDVLRNLLIDVFANAGYDANDASTWASSASATPRNLLPGRIYLDVPYEERNLAVAAADRSGVNIDFQRDGVGCWHVDQYHDSLTRWPKKQWGKVNPTLSHLLQYASRRREMSFTGLGQREAMGLGKVHKRARSLTQALRKLEDNRGAHGSRSEEADTARESLEEAKQEMLQSMEAYLKVLESGGALQALLRYDSFESLSTVTQIIDSLNSSGIFRDTSPAFDTKKPIFRYLMNALHPEMQKFLLNVRLNELFRRHVQLGETEHLRTIVIIDEGAKFLEKEDDHIINVMALEARKFGLAIWVASQSPTQFPESFMAMMATKVVLGLDTSFWKKAQTQMRIGEKELAWIRPRESLLVNRKLSGQGSQPWQRVISTTAV